MSETQLILFIYLLVGARLALHLYPGLIPRESVLRAINEHLDSFIVAGAAALFLITFVVRSFYIPSESMLPTLRVHDYILVNKFIYRFCKPHRGDIIVFHPPESAITDPEKKDFIKRVIAIEGDTVEIRDGWLYLNGQKQHEPYVLQEPFDRGGDYPRRRVPAGHVFMMGDNRNNSEDSRSWGFLPLENVVGKAFVIFFPPHRIRWLGSGHSTGFSPATLPGLP